MTRCRICRLCFKVGKFYARLWHRVPAKYWRLRHRIARRYTKWMMRSYTRSGDCGYWDTMTYAQHARLYVAMTLDFYTHKR